jgi:4-carboxymuconolactone decarboxylase
MHGDPDPASEPMRPHSQSNDHPPTELASDAGIGAEVISAITENRMPSFASEDESITYAFANELLAQGRVSDDTFNRSVARFGYQMVIEIVGGF